jgi:hypothetical protein
VPLLWTTMYFQRPRLTGARSMAARMDGER